MKALRVAAILLTLVSAVLASRLELSKDLTGLFPRTREAEALARITRALGGGDVDRARGRHRGDHTGGT